MGTRCRKQNTGGAIHEIQSEPENSLFRRMNSLFRKRTGNLPQAVQIALRFCVGHRRNGPKQAEFRKIPC